LDCGTASASETHFVLRWGQGGITSCHNTHVWSPSNLHCCTASNSLHYFLVNMWTIYFWGTFNSRLLPAFTTGQVTTSFGRHFCPGQIEHVAPTWKHTTSVRSASHTVLNWPYGNYLGHGGTHAWSPHSPDLSSVWGDTWKTWCTWRNCRHEMNSYSY
jgi:hypothetical protein